MPSIVKVALTIGAVTVAETDVPLDLICMPGEDNPTALLACQAIIRGIGRQSRQAAPQDPTNGRYTLVRAYVETGHNPSLAELLAYWEAGASRG